MSRTDFVEEIEHTADQAIIIQAAGLAELFKLGVKGMYSIMDIKQSHISKGTIIIKITSDDLEGLLVDFLSKILNFIELKNIYLDIIKLSISGKKLVATCEKFGPITYSKAIKAVTYHDLKIENHDDLWKASITFDV